MNGNENFDEFKDALRHVRYWLNEVDSIDFVGLSPIWYRANFRARFQELVHDLYKYSIYPNINEDEKED